MNADEAERWLRYAREDLTAAEDMLGRDNSYPRHVCCLAQQAAEKALKAGLIYSNIEFPYTHDLDRLRDLLPEGWHVRSQCPELAELTVWAIQSRYPGDAPDVMVADAEAAVKLARRVFDSVISNITASDSEADEPAQE